MKYLNSYVPSQVRCKIFGIPIEGFSESNIVDIERDNDVTTFRKAMDGSRTAFKDKYGSYRLTFHVNQTSEANTWLHLLFKLYQKTNVEFKMPIEVEERMSEGGTKFFALDCFLRMKLIQALHQMLVLKHGHSFVTMVATHNKVLMKAMSFTLRFNL